MVVAVGWLVRHELARRSYVGEPLPATAPAAADAAVANPAEAAAGQLAVPDAAGQLTVPDAAEVPV